MINSVLTDSYHHFVRGVAKRCLGDFIKQAGKIAIFHQITKSADQT